jgi:hypothetical protein
MDNCFEVAVGAGTMMSASGAVVRFPHRWTPGGVTVEADFTGAHLLHLAAAGCVLNDVYREAATLGIELKGVRVTAAGGFDAATWQSMGIGYSVEVSSDCPRRSARPPAQGGRPGSRDSSCHPSRSHRPVDQLSRVPPMRKRRSALAA